MRVSNGSIRTAKQLTPEERQRRSEQDANYVCRWIVQASAFQTHTFPKNIVDLAKRAIE